jgi:glycosyltransferase involved in cell wall biosynthesis
MSCRAFRELSPEGQQEQDLAKTGETCKVQRHLKEGSGGLPEAAVCGQMGEAIAVVWARFGPYHMDRCEALGERMTGRRVYGIEIVGRDRIYAWEATGPGASFTKHTLFPAETMPQTSSFGRLLGLLRVCVRVKARHVFLPSYDRYEFFVLAVALRLLRRRVYLLMVSKFDDKPRRLWREIGKSLLLKPYCGALAAGTRSEQYLRFLGFRKPVVTGHNTVSLARVLEGAGGGSLDRPAFAARPFVIVARFVPKKDIGTALAAYARYRELAAGAAHGLHICGSGALEGDIRQRIADLALDGVVLHGFLQREGVARVLAGGLALIVPSIEEQWGLVVNEALAFGLPILATDQVGARDLLIRTGVNGYIFEPGNSDGLAQLMLRLATDEAEWRRLVEGSHGLRPLADVDRFVDGVVALIQGGARATIEIPDGAHEPG